MDETGLTTETARNMTSSMDTATVIYNDSSDNSNETCGTRDPELTALLMYSQTTQIIISLVLFVLIVIGNVCVIVAILFSKTGRRSRMNFFIMNLAAADLSAAFFSVLPDSIYRLVGIWYAGNAFCKIVEFLKQTVTFASTYVLVALSVDRLDAIARPMSFGSSGKRAKISIAVAWILSVLFASPALYLYNTYDIRCLNIKACGLTMITTQLHYVIYIWAILVVLFIIPTITIIVCYVVIINVIWSKAKLMTPATSSSHGSGRWLRNKFKRLTSKDDGTTCMTTPASMNHNSSHPDASHSSSRGVIPQAKIRTIKMTLVIVTAFILCWSPFFVHQMMDVYGLVGKSVSEVAVSVMVQSLGVLNNLANPIVYGIFSTRVCRNLRKIRVVNWLLNKICCCCCGTVQHYKRRFGHGETTGSDFLSTTDSPKTRGSMSMSYHGVPSRDSKRNAGNANACTTNISHVGSI